jgi:hypothetical protein
MGDVLDELCGLIPRDRSDGVDLDPLGEFVHRHQDVLVAARSRLEWSHRVKAPNGKGPGWLSCPQDLSRDMLLLGEELATLASLKQVLSVGHSGRPVKTQPVGFPHQVCGGCVVTAFPAVDFLQELKTFRSEDALH